MKNKISLQSDSILKFLKNLRPDFQLPDKVEIMNPYSDPNGFQYAKIFYEKYYDDTNERFYIIGINPGRHGGGITGIPFTDPQKLESVCNIPNPFPKRTELSADFIYKMIAAFGGPENFYRKYFFTAVSPLGFVINGKNLNYYDDKNLMKNAEPFIIDCFQQQLKNIPSGSTAFCLGEGSNYKYLSKLNERFGFFKEIIPLPHPRWIMQYRRKEVEKYVGLYVERLTLNV